MVCGFFETIAIFSPISALSNVDLPTFGLPHIEMKALFVISSLPCYPYLFHQVSLLLLHELPFIFFDMVVADQMQYGMYG